MLAASRLWEIVSNSGVANPEYVMRSLMRTHRFLHKRSNLLEARFTIAGVARLEKRTNYLAVMVVFDGDDAGFRYRWMVDDSLFDFGRVYVFAPYRGLMSALLQPTLLSEVTGAVPLTTNNHIFNATSNNTIAVAIDEPLISSIHPANAILIHFHSFCRLGLIPVVAQLKRIPAHANLSRSTSRHNIAISIDDFGPRMRHNSANRPFPLVLRVTYGRHERHWTRLRHAVDNTHLLTPKFLF